MDPDATRMGFVYVLQTKMDASKLPEDLVPFTGWAFWELRAVSLRECMSFPIHLRRVLPVKILQIQTSPGCMGGSWDLSERPGHQRALNQHLLRGLAIKRNH